MTTTPTGAHQDHTNDPALRSWVDSANGHTDFPLQNLPFGVFSPSGDPGEARGGMRIGDSIVDLPALAASGVLDGAALRAAQLAAGPTLNALLGAGSGPRRALRARVQALLTRGAADRDRLPALLSPADAVTMHLPVTVGDYTDFYAGVHHATAVGALFRPDEPLLPNYWWVPIGYHGRASSIRLSGEGFHRPRGQRMVPGEAAPRYEPTQRLDFELELGAWIGPGNAPGQPIPIGAAADHVAGYCLLNDWSARDIQAWEYQPLGPFLAKSFATTVSGWVVTPEALAPFRVAAFVRDSADPDPLPYLRDERDQQAGGLEIDLEVLLVTAAMRRRGTAPQLISRSSSRHLYWTVAQLVAHHSSGGCALRPGDLLGTGTISGPERDGRGSLLERTANGVEPLTLPSGETRTFLEDGDEIVLRARAHRDGAVSIGFGECRAVVLPAVDP